MSAKCEYCGRFASKFDNVIRARMVGDGLSVDEYLRCIPCRDKESAALSGGAERVPVMSIAAALRAASRVMAGLGGVHCACNLMHDDKPYRERPEATYVMYWSPCEASCCVGAVVCVGHAVCVHCCAAIRAGRTKWNESGADVDIHFVSGRTSPAVPDTHNPTEEES